MEVSGKLLEELAKNYPAGLPDSLMTDTWGREVDLAIKALDVERREQHEREVASLQLERLVRAAAPSQQ